MLKHCRQLKQDYSKIFKDAKSLLMKAERKFLDSSIKSKTKGYAQLYIMAKLHKKKTKPPLSHKKNCLHPGQH